MPGRKRSVHPARRQFDETIDLAQAFGRLSVSNAGRLVRRRARRARKAPTARRVPDEAGSDGGVSNSNGSMRGLYGRATRECAPVSGDTYYRLRKGSAGDAQSSGNALEGWDGRSNEE
jgi:hypothetical protein